MRWWEASPWRSAAVAAICVLLARLSAAEQLSERVLVVVNGYESASKKVAEHYMQARGIPASQKCSVKPSAKIGDGTATIDWHELHYLRRDIQSCMERAGKTKILYIVLSYLMPYRISSAPKEYGAALDSYLEDLWDTAPPAGGGRALNLYFAASQPKANLLPPFVSFADFRDAPGAPLIYSVWRLDGPTTEFASSLVDKAIAIERSRPLGLACFDRRYGDGLQNESDEGYNEGDWELLRAAELARAAGLRVLEDTNDAEFGTPPAPARCDHALLYAGWYSLGRYNDAFSWNIGAIGWHLDSLSLMDPRGGPSWSAEALRRGITVTSGAIDEPFLAGLPRPFGIVSALLHGANVGDAFFRNTQWIRWQIINVGDPLYRPWGSKSQKR